MLTNMIKTEFSPALNAGDEQNGFFSLLSLLYGLNLGLLGAFFNYFLSFHFLGSTNLFFGQFFVLLCLITRGLNPSVIAVLISSCSAAVFAGDPYLVAIFSLEMLTIHVLLRRGRFFLQAAISYWLVLGVPLFILLNGLTTPMQADVLFISAVTLAINGLLCASIVAMICWFLPTQYIYFRYYSAPPSLASIIFSLCMLTVTLPALIISLFLIWQSNQHNERTISKTIDEITTQALQFNDTELQRHLDGLSTIADVVGQEQQIPLQSFLSATSRNYSMFESLLIADKEGKILRAAPQQYAAILDNKSWANIKRREYFIDAKTSLKPVVSDAIVGKGFGDLLLVSLAVPIKNQGKFDGIVQGSIPLETLMSFNKTIIPDGYEYVITDTKGRIISCSQSLECPLMSNFDFTKVNLALIKQLNVLRFNQQTFLFQQATTKAGWQVTILTTSDAVTSLLIKNFIILVASGSLILALFAWVARLLSRKITRPLVDISEHLSNKDLHPTLIDKAQVSSEMVKLTHRLIDSHDVMRNFQQQLSEQVHNKTKQLKRLNKELYSIAQKDSLTQLLNRAGFNRLAITSYRNCVRNHINMSLILIDIDHFKVINDTYGHPFGDKCIVAVAKTIQKHCKRDTDIIGRYGGEEFIIMIVGGETSEHNQRIEMIRQEIEKLKFRNGQSIVQMTVSAGLCSLREDFSVDFEDLLQLADEQLYQSKRTGRNRISSINH